MCRPAAVESAPSWRGGYTCQIRRVREFLEVAPCESLPPAYQTQLEAFEGRFPRDSSSVTRAATGHSVGASPRKWRLGTAGPRSRF